MALVTLHRMFDLAAPRLHAERDGQSSRPSAGSSLPTAAKGWLLSVASLRRVFSSSLVSADRTARSREDEPSMRRALDALAHITAAVQATHLVGEGAGHTPARGNP